MEHTNATMNRGTAAFFTLLAIHTRPADAPRFPRTVSMTQTMVRDRALLRWPYMRASMPTAMSRKPTDWVGNIILLNSSTAGTPKAFCIFQVAFRNPARNTNPAPKGSSTPEQRSSLFFRSL